MKRYRRHGSEIQISADDADVERCSVVDGRYYHHQISQRRRRMRKITWLNYCFGVHKSSLVVDRRVAFNLVFAMFAVLMVHESGYYIVLNVLVRLPGGTTPYFGGSTRMLSPQVTTRGANSTRNSDMALISLHRGVKFAGYLGTWLDGNKAQYADRHGYSYFNQDEFGKCSNQLADLSPWQSVYRRRLMFDKLRFILHILQHYPTLQYALWMDGDAVIANADITLEARIDEFQQLRTNFLLVWASDSQPNAGVLLIRNCAETRALLVQSLRDDESVPQHTRSEETFTDQFYLTRAVYANATYRNGQLLLTESTSRKLQSRVRGASSGLYKPGDWILHLPNHNRIDFLFSLYQHFRIHQ